MPAPGGLEPGKIVIQLLLDETLLTEHECIETVVLKSWTELVFFTNIGLQPLFHRNKQKSFSWKGGITFSLQTERKPYTAKNIFCQEKPLALRSSRTMGLFRLIWAPCALTVQENDLRISLLTGAQPLGQAVQPYKPAPHLHLPAKTPLLHLSFHLSVHSYCSFGTLCIPCFTSSDFQASASALCMLPPTALLLWLLSLIHLNWIFPPSIFSGHQLPFLRKLNLSGVFRLWNLTDIYKLHTIWVFQDK